MQWCVIHGLRNVHQWHEAMQFDQPVQLFQWNMLPPLLKVCRWRKDVPPNHLYLFIQLYGVISQVTVIFTVKCGRITHNLNSPFNFLINSTHTYLNPPASFFCETSSLQFRYNCPDSFTEYNIGQQLWPYKTNLIQQLHQFLSVQH